MKVSVVIATRNRAERLRATLEGFRAMEPLPGGPGDWELILVDDGSTDATPRLLREALARRDLPLRAMEERRRGKPFALNAGLRRARGELIAFTDDDCIVAPDWLRAVVREFESAPGLGGLGGRVELYDPADGPVAVRTSRTRRVLSSVHELYDFAIGANMAFRREVLRDLRFFDPRVGPGALVPSGNDIDLLYRALRRGHEVVYAPDVVVLHNHGRQSDAQLAQVRRRYTVGRGAFYMKGVLGGDLEVARMGARELLDAATGVFRGPRDERRREVARLLDLSRGLGRGAAARLLAAKGPDPTRAARDGVAEIAV